jgi:uncharacterized alkaline shock family protein YloU
LSGRKEVAEVNEALPGTVTIAPEVLVTIVRLTTQAIPGVHAMSGDWTRDVNRFLGNARVGDGVQTSVQGDRVSVDLYVVVEPGTNMLDVGRTIQEEVTRAIEDMLGMEVREVNVHIEDIHYPLAES